MSVTSGTFSFLSPQVATIVEEAFDRIGILPNVITEHNVTTALRSINCILSSWINRELNLWTVKQGMLALTNGQTAYQLSAPTSTILEATLRTSNRALGGTAFSSAGGVASNAFDGNPNTACTQNAPNGYISYNWNTAQFTIAMVGIQSNANLTYTLVAEYSNDNINWFNALTIPSQTYATGALNWFVIPVPTPSSVFRIRETGGATLNIQELYFNVLIYDTIINPISRAEWMSLPQKNQTGRPSSFYLDRQIVPTVYLWPTPNSLFNNLFYTFVETMQDIGNLINIPQIPPRFVEPLIAKLAHSLSVKRPEMGLDRINYLEVLSEKELTLAMAEDRERVPLRIYGDFTQGWTRQ